MIILWGVIAGIVVGMFSGLVGVGGGVILVPILIYFFKMNQHMAQGTSLTMLLPPTGLLAFLQYYRTGNANLKLGFLLSIGVFLGGYFGGQVAQYIPTVALRRIFALVLLGTALKMFFQK